MQKTQCVSGKYVRSARSVHSGSGVKNAVCVHRRWRRTNPELDHGWVKRLTCANGTWMTSLSCEVEVWDHNHQWFLMYALYLTTALLHTFTSIWFFSPPPLWSNVYTNCKWCTLKCPMLQPEWHNKSWVTHGATCNHASLCVRRGNDTFSPSLSPVSKTLSIDLGMFPYSDAIVHHCDRFDGKQTRRAIFYYCYIIWHFEQMSVNDKQTSPKGHLTVTWLSSGILSK